LDLPENSSDYTIEIFDVLGKNLAIKSIIGENTFDMSKFPTGLYYLKIGYNGQFVIRQVLKK